MRFRDPKTGKVFENAEKAFRHFCNQDIMCEVCPLILVRDCYMFSMEYPAIAAQLIGYEVIEDAQTVSGDTPTETHDNVDHPAHYNQGGVECIDALKAATVGLEGIQAFCAANAIKYIWRFKDKNGAEDLDKAIWYIQRLKEEIGNG